MKKLFSATLVFGALAAYQPQERSLDILGPVPELGHGLMEGYLHGEPPLNSAAFLPAPPSEGSARQQADDAASEALRGLEGSARRGQAASDADLHFPAATPIFNCALGATVSKAQTPALYRLLQRSLTDLGLAPTRPKKHTNGPALFSSMVKRSARRTSGSYWRPMAPIQAVTALSVGAGPSSGRN